MFSINKRIVFVSFILEIIVIGGLFVAYSNFVTFRWRDQIVSDIHSLEKKPIAIVFGGGMKEDGTMSDMQNDRVEQGIKLYQAGKVDSILVTGDDGAWRFNEVDAMHDAVVAAGVPDEDVEIDPHGYNTYRSCYRAKHQFDINEAIVVSQRFHLYRILYFCNTFGIDAVGYPADVGPYGLVGTIRTMWIRETLARVKGWWQVGVTKPVY